MPNGKQKREQGLPFVTIMLPIRNEVDHIDTCIGRLLGQDYPAARMEIIVVDGMSDDGTRERLSDLVASSGTVPIRVLDNPERVVPPALNIAIRAARGDVIVRMDGHTTPAPNYVSASVAAIQESGAANAGGLIEPTGLTPMGAAVAVATRHPLGVGDARYRTGGKAGFVDTVPFGAFRRDVFERVGLFDESMVRNQDSEMNVRIRRAGEGVYFDPEIRSVYTPRGDIRSLWRQYLQYGWWRVETLRRHPSSLRWRQVIPPVFVMAVLVLGALAAVWSPAVVVWLGMVGSYLATITLVSYGQRSDSATTAQIALAFVIVHCSWGLGFALNVLTAGRFPYRARRPVVPLLPPRDNHAVGSVVDS